MTNIRDISIGEGSQFFSVAFEHAFQVYDIDPIRRRYFREFSSFSLTHIASNSEATITCFSIKPASPDKNIVYIWSNFFGSLDDQIDFHEPINRLIIRGNFLIVILETSVCIYDLDTKQKILEQVTDSNPYAAGDFISAVGFKKMAICGLIPGAVQIVTIGNESRPVFFQAHCHTLTHIKFSLDASLIATASEEGTLIRLHDSLTGACISVYRRGRVPGRILGISFSRENSKLIAISSKGTVHVFDATSRRNDEDGERAYTKVQIEKECIAEIAFKTDFEGIIISNSGIIRTIRASDKQVEISSSVLYLSH